MVSCVPYLSYAIRTNLSDLELSIAPELNHKLVPAHMKSVLASRGLDIDNFQPLSKAEMMAKLD